MACTDCKIADTCFVVYRGVELDSSTKPPCAIRAEAHSAAPNSDYATALSVFDRWVEECNIHAPAERVGFRQWLRTRLNPPKAANCA
jgi:hypothetical protein